MTGNESRPEWLGSREGISYGVLEPWTPVEVECEDGDGLLVRVWGREYAFAVSPFLDGVETAGASVLAAPVMLRGEVDDKEVQWEAAAADVKVQTPAVTAFTRDWRAGDLQLSARTEIEYDGMVRIDWELTAARAVTVQRLSLEIALQAEHARYLYHFPGSWGEVYNAGALPAEGFEGPFRPFIWLGDEERGLSWFCESDRNWLPADKERVTEIAREGERTVIRLHLVDVPLTIGPYSRDKLSYTFGFQATPVKPVVKDVWDYRACHAGNYGIEELPADAPATLTYEARGNMPAAEGTLEFWVKPLFDPEAPGAEQPLVTVSVPGGEAALHWPEDGAGPAFRLQMGGDVATAMNAGQHWRRGEFHHVALSWGQALRLYVDGSLVAEDARTGLLGDGLMEGEITFGSAGGHLVVDEIRTSSVTRSEDEIAAAATGPGELDEKTLLLDHLDEAFAPGAVEHLDGSTHGLPRTHPAKGDGLGAIGLRGACAYSRFVEGRFGNGLQLGLERKIIDELADLGVRTVCFHEQWTDAESYTKTAYGEQLHSLVKACHERGMQILIYFGFLISDLAPEFEEWADKCLVEPRRGYDPYDYAPQPLQKAFTCCYNSPWQDFLAQGIAELMDEYDVDGVYLDGTANPHECRNLRHGCGYLQDDGTAASSYPIFATRQMMRRIYTLVKSRKPDGQVNVHQSTCMTIPTLAWATGYWDGEQFSSIKAGPFALETLPLDSFRTEFMGHQWGVPAEFLCYDRPYTYEQACAFTLLHDVLVRGNGLDPHLELEAKLWRLADEFGRKEAQWLPYWRNEEYVTARPEGVLASLYRHERNGTLAVVANLGQKQEEAVVELDLAGLGLGKHAKAVDALTGEALEIDGGKVAVELASLGWRIVWVRGSKG